MWNSDCIFNRTLYYIAVHITKYYTNVLNIIQYFWIGFGNVYNYVLERTSLSSSFRINHVYRKGPGTIYTASTIGFTVYIIYSNRYLTDNFQFLFNSFNFGLYSLSKLKTKTDEINYKFSTYSKISDT